MRYSTNVAAWKARMPIAILSWHGKIDKAMPIDLMP